MALQNSGPIKISEIKTELGSASNSLRTLSGAAGFSVPDAMSEFYGYSAGTPNLYYIDYDGVNDYVRGTASGISPYLFSISQWVRVDAVTKHNLAFFVSVATNLTLNNGRFHIWYNSGLNRLIAGFIQNFGSNLQYKVDFPLHNNSSVTGISNSSTGWVAGQRGNVDSDGFCMITVTVDAREANALNGIKAYWNGSLMTSTTSVQSQYSPDAQHNFVSLNDFTNVAPPSASMHEGAQDEFKLYDRVLSPSEVLALYNAGKKDAATAGVTAGLMTELRMENNLNDTGGIFSLTNNGATFRAY
jgi:hypothetical protein